MEQLTNVQMINNFFEEEKENIVEKLKSSEKEIKNGEGFDADVVFKELRQKYGY